MPERTAPEPNDGPGPDGHHTVTGECFACLVGVATGPESHGLRCRYGRKLDPKPWVYRDDDGKIIHRKAEWEEDHEEFAPRSEYHPRREDYPNA